MALYTVQIDHGRRGKKLLYQGHSKVLGVAAFEEAASGTEECVVTLYRAHRGKIELLKRGEIVAPTRKRRRGNPLSPSVLAKIAARENRPPGRKKIRLGPASPGAPK